MPDDITDLVNASGSRGWQAVASDQAPQIACRAAEELTQLIFALPRRGLEEAIDTGRRAMGCHRWPVTRIGSGDRRALRLDRGGRSRPGVGLACDLAHAIAASGAFDGVHLSPVCGIERLRPASKDVVRPTDRRPNGRLGAPRLHY